MGTFVATELANFESPVGSGALGEYDPSFRIGDGWLQDFRKGPGTVIGEKPDPRVKGAWNCHGVHTVRIYRRDSGLE